MLAQVTHILPLTQIHRERTLPRPGRILVRVGQKVGAADVIAQTEIPSGHLVLDIRRGLNLSQAGAAEDCIIRHPGDRLQKGDVIAESGGLISRIIRAPMDGELISIHAGQVLLRTNTSAMEVRAGVSGTVIEILQDRGAVIEANGALIQAVWGNGKVDSGLLAQPAHPMDDPLLPRHLDVSMRGAVVFAGHCASAETLQTAAEIPLRGLILASIPASLIPAAASQNYPIVVVEGFGNLAMNEAARRILAGNEKQETSVNAEFRPKTGIRPEVLIGLQPAGRSAPDEAYFAPGKAVRIQGTPYTGKTGVFVQLRQGRYTLPNGLRVFAADVQLENDTRVTVPLVNLEVIE
jgi:hypothetical protein